jgi:hypothetical protein
MTTAAMPLHAEFLMPVTVEAAQDALSKLPSEFSAGLNGLILLGGSEKQRVAVKKICYGRYFNYWRVIIVHAFSKRLMN